jgi:putative ABC transport system permease protein
VKQASLALGAEDAFYVAMGQWDRADQTQSLVVRTAGDPASLAPAVEGAIRSVDPNLPITRVTTMADLVRRSESRRRFVLLVFETFGLVALALAALGVYGTMSGWVVERTRELGVRSALGASSSRLVALILVQGLSLALTGAAVGLAVAAGGSRILSTLLFSVSPFDPATYAGVTLLLITASALACWLPAWRASRIDPARTLRAD